MDSAKRSKALLIISTLLLGSILGFYWQAIVAWVASPSPPHQKLTLAVTTYPGSGLAYLAAARGYFTEEGLDVTLLPYTSGRDALNATIERRADLGTVADLPVMYATMRGQPVSIVATIFTAGRAYGVIANRDREISSLKDMKGKVVGVTMRTDGHFVLSTMLARHRLALNQVRVENVPPEEMKAALQSGKVDAVATWEPWLSAANNALGDKGVEFRTDGGFVLDYNLAGSTEWVVANPDKIQRLLRALLRAKRFFDEKPKEAQAMIVGLMRIDPSTFDTVGPNYRFVVQLDQNLLIMLEDQASWAIQNKFSVQTAIPNFLSAINMDALTAVQPEAVKIVR
ncbi:MAG: NrtA/SsuA/CpmA family ABC transporter substrate-binding protein [Burkholderiales bacterium]|nr:NrtA/SsuA/CpmA family ABC transporter substrate-binding protein [Burkholderiales bacterium]